MAGKKLWELTMSELNHELEMAGIFGLYSESLAVIKLTIHLVRNRENPSTFQFQSSKESDTVDVPAEVKEDGLLDDFEKVFIPGLLPAMVEVPRDAKEDQEVQSGASGDHVDGNPPELADVPKEVIGFSTIISNDVKAADSVLVFTDDEIVNSVEENEGCKYPFNAAKVAESVPGLTDLLYWKTFWKKPRKKKHGIHVLLKM